MRLSHHLPVAALVLLAAPALAAEHTIDVRDNFFQPSSLTIESGDTVTWVHREFGIHNVHADDNSFRCANGCDDSGGNGDPASNDWSFSRTFNGDPRTIRYYCDVHGGPGGAGMAGTIQVKAAQPPPPQNIPINFGLTGSWFNADENGQGFLFEVVPLQAGQQGDPTGVLYWFTFAKGQPGGLNKQRWYQAQGAIQGDVAMLDTVLQVTGGVFDDPVDPSEVVDVGTVMLTFTSCTEGKVAYDLDLDGDGQNETTGEIPITRLTPDVLCQSMLNGN